MAEYELEPELSDVDDEAPEVRLEDVTLTREQKTIELMRKALAAGKEPVFQNEEEFLGRLQHFVNLRGSLTKKYSNAEADGAGKYKETASIVKEIFGSTKCRDGWESVNELSMTMVDVATNLKIPLYGETDVNVTEAVQKVFCK